MPLYDFTVIMLQNNINISKLLMYYFHNFHQRKNLDIEISTKPDIHVIPQYYYLYLLSSPRAISRVDFPSAVSRLSLFILLRVVAQKLHTLFRHHILIDRDDAVNNNFSSVNPIHSTPSGETVKLNEKA